jgi:hypothetical protein
VKQCGEALRLIDLYQRGETLALDAELAAFGLPEVIRKKVSQYALKNKPAEISNPIE